MKVRASAARVWPSFARAQLMVAQAQIGYATMVLNRRTLAGMSGQRLNSVFEARPVAESALERLGRLADDTPGWAEAWFEANVTLAASHAQLGSTERAGEFLETAKELDPARAQADSRFLHVHGLLVETRRAIVDLHRAVELDSSSDVAQYDLASALEMMWRARTTLERDVAEVVRDEYERVLTVNPGNISAWGNLGYIEWLLDDLDEAKRVFERGREYKEIKRETFVSELDYGLARIAAERGEFNEAYRRYIDAAGARFGQGIAHDPGYTAYQFARVTRAVVARFETYRDRVHDKWAEFGAKERQDPSERVRNAVYAFVLNDYAEACLNYFLRSANRRYLDKAKDALEYAERDLKASSSSSRTGSTASSSGRCGTSTLRRRGDNARRSSSARQKGSAEMRSGTALRPRRTGKRDRARSSRSASKAKGTCSHSSGRERSKEAPPVQGVVLNAASAGRVVTTPSQEPLPRRALLPRSSSRFR
jgi:tetratricopeptide (TPR) repeat protein